MDAERWERRLYRRSKVHVRVDARGEPVVDARGLAAIRYQVDDPREYSVRPAELEPLTPEALAHQEKERAHRRRRDAAIHIFTAGAAEPGGGPAGAGIVLEGDGYRRQIALYLGTTSGAVAELVAVLEGLRRIRDRRRPVRLAVESAHVESVLAGAWKGEANRALIERVQALCRRFSRLEVQRVRQRGRHELHVLAETLAGRAVQEQRTREELKAVE
ncbi:MAG: hypothetical protein JXQ29_02130 [Planctomycetes bacterium]|nr:hypothetical protein [Planctomycetota bacterium]